MLVLAIARFWSLLLFSIEPGTRVLDFRSRRWQKNVQRTPQRLTLFVTLSFSFDSMQFEQARCLFSFYCFFVLPLEADPFHHKRLFVFMSMSKKRRKERKEKNESVCVRDRWLSGVARSQCVAVAHINKWKVLSTLPSLLSSHIRTHINAHFFPSGFFCAWFCFFHFISCAFLSHPSFVSLLNSNRPFRPQNFPCHNVWLSQHTLFHSGLLLFSHHRPIHHTCLRSGSTPCQPSHLHNDATCKNAHTPTPTHLLIPPFPQPLFKRALHFSFRFTCSLHNSPFLVAHFSWPHLRQQHIVSRALSFLPSLSLFFASHQPPQYRRTCHIKSSFLPYLSYNVRVGVCNWVIIGRIRWFSSNAGWMGSANKKSVENLPSLSLLLLFANLIFFRCGFSFLPHWLIRFYEAGFAGRKRA